EEQCGDRIHGAFTLALVELLRSVAEERLPLIRWCEIMPELRERVTRRSAFQHPRVLGSTERLIFGGPWKAREPGYAIRCQAEKFEIAAGTNTGLSVGAEVAVYGDEPARFPEIGSPADLAARIALVEVVAAGPSSCTAR